MDIKGLEAALVFQESQLKILETFASTGNKDQQKKIEKTKQEIESLKKQIGRLSKP